MSGHSKWNNIKRKKEGTDAKRAKIFTKIGREIALAVKSGGPNPVSNTKLRDIIAKAKANNVPNDNITREQMAAIMMRYADYKGIDTSARADISGFADANDVSGWAYENMQWANAVGLINGRGNNMLVPQGNTTRAETAAILMRFCENIL